MAITYSCIANGRVVLTELALAGGSYQEAAAKVLRHVLLKAEPRTIIQIGSYVYHALFMDGITYLCATDNSLDTVTPYAFLQKVSEIFARNPLMSQDFFFPSSALAADFQQILGKYMMKYNEKQNIERISTIRSQVTDVKNVMMQNIEAVLERESMNISLGKTDDPQTTAEESKKPRKIPRRIWWKYLKRTVMTTLAILLPIIIILLSTNVIPT